ncbi:MAG: hypothetical protein KAT30_10670, partial [Candidatus Krumholzibacteria bacterium]|nr:hypothetical protein [Candidatus Krumholzibacteria bacterium]
AIVEGSRAYCAGWTKAVEMDGVYQAWFAEISLDNLPITNRVALLEMLPAGDAQEGEVADHEGSREGKWHLRHRD